jgi:hypothetical protein
MKEEMQETRKCEWCAKEIPQEALKCPHCGKFRKDISKDKFRCYLCAFFMVLALFSFFLGIRKGAWIENRSIWNMPLSGVYGFEDFSFREFISDDSGLMILIGFGIVTGLFIYQGVRTGKKLGWF